MPVIVKDHRAAFLRNFEQGRQKGIVAAADLLLKHLKKAFGSGYYTTGRYRQTLGVKQSLRRTGAERGPQGYFARVGSRYGDIKKPKGAKSKKYQLVPLYWELGHNNVITGKYERHEIFKPTALQQQAAIRAEFAKTFKRYADRPLT